MEEVTGQYYIVGVTIIVLWYVVSFIQKQSSNGYNASNFNNNFWPQHCKYIRRSKY